jgi:hypothetical protein
MEDRGKCYNSAHLTKSLLPTSLLHLEVESGLEELGEGHRGKIPSLEQGGIAELDCTPEQRFSLQHIFSLFS